ncbi:MAG: cupin domain-containing protein [Ignavibacteria bacterium]|jgi:quercetin dioxygenase-like cupin family protein|nr:cupin domain-containing protein [Ignavibacteria bacterium]
MYVKNIDNIPVEKIEAGENTFKQVLISPEEAPNFAMRKFIIEPFGFMPLHTNAVEHEQLVLNGKAKVIIGESEFEVKKNDVVFIPANTPHSYKTIGDEAFEFLCIVPNKEDKIIVVKDECA